MLDSSVSAIIDVMSTVRASKRGVKPSSSAPVPMAPTPLVKPLGLSDKGKRVWDRVVRVLPDGYLTGSEADVLGLYCETIVRHRLISKQLESKGYSAVDEDGKTVRSFWAVEEDRLSKRLSQLATQLGLTVRPAARPRLQVDAGGGLTIREMLSED